MNISSPPPSPSAATTGASSTLQTGTTRSTTCISIQDYVSVFLLLLSKPTESEIRVLLNFRLVNPATGVSESKELCEIPVPPSDLLDNLGHLLESGEGADVAFQVKGEVFHAHKVVLAMRSHVFKVELYGPMRGKQTKTTVTVEDMQPAVFKALLHFIYKDSLPAMDDLGKDEYEEMVKHLLVAADRYAMERMKVMCKSILAERLRVESVAATLALADQHHCRKLKDACIGFVNSTGRMYDVMESEGYEHLKRACPAIFTDIWEKAAKSRKI